MNHKYKNALFIRVPKTASTSIKSTCRDVMRLQEAQDFFKTRQNKPLYYRTKKYLNVMDRTHEWFNPIQNNIFVFGFVRNPWARAVSSWRFGSPDDNWNMDFVNFCRNLKKLEINPKCGVAKNGLLIHICEQHPFLVDKNKNLKANYIGRFENLQQDFDIICDKIGIPRQELPHKNKTNHKHYTEYYDDETRQIVAEKFAKDIEYFGYKFGE